MRELKFRAWDKVQGKYIEVVRMQFSLARTPILITQELSDKQLLTDPASMYAIEQYTGLKDKNDKEIYEGDIVQIDDHILGDFEVLWHNLGWTIKRSVGFETLSVHKSEDIVVIGNVHENPELLEEE